MAARQGGPGPRRGGGPGGAMMRGGEKPKDIKATLSKFLKYLGKYKIGIALIIILSVAASLFNIAGPKLLGNATDVIYNSVSKSLSTGIIEIDYAALKKIVLTLVGLYQLSYIFSVIRGLTMSGIANNITYQFRKDIDEKINRLPLSYFDTTSTGDVLSRMTNDVDSISQSIRETITELVSSFIAILGTVAMMLTISPKLTAIAIIMIPINLFIIMNIVKISQPLYRKQQRSLGKVNGHIEEMMSNHIIVKSFNLEEKSIAEFSKHSDELYNNAWKSAIASRMMMPITNFIGNAGYVLVCILGAKMAVSGEITVGNIQSFVQYIRRFNQPVQQISNVMTMLQSSLACSERIFEFLDAPEEEPDTENPHETRSIIGNVEFKNVTFGYTPEETVIDNFNLDVHPGEKVAIVGPTGAGKTTIVKLLMRFYELNGGSITIDGIDIRDFARNDLREMFGMVLQDTWLFKGSIRDNIMYSKPDRSEDEMIRAAKRSHVHHFVSSLPSGYDFELNEETSNISQGQKQLITIARAFLQNPKILILDEATSSVDTRTEVAIQKAMQNLMQDRTSFIIAHRLSTIRDADKIIVMNGGRIVEVGNHRQLLKRGGFYANLYKSQFENT